MEYYFYIKAIHIICFTVWMAMLFYLPRLFVYHAMHKDSHHFTDVAEVQERKLYYYIGCPGLIATLITGSMLIHLNPSVFSTGGWLHAKLSVVVLLIILHLYCGVLMKGLRDKTSNKSSVFFRVINELPTIALIFIVICAVAKPF